jgi:hypothetical protein
MQAENKTIERETLMQDVLGYISLYEVGNMEVSRFRNDDDSYTVVAIDKTTNSWLMIEQCGRNNRTQEQNRKRSASVFARYCQKATARHNTSLSIKCSEVHA